MKYPQKDLICYALAILALAMSLAFWARLAGFGKTMSRSGDPAPTLHASAIESAAPWKKAERRTVVSELRGTVVAVATARGASEDAQAPAEGAPAEDAGEVALSGETMEDAAPVLPEEPEDEITQWEIARAYTLAIPSLGIRAPVLLPSLTFWSGREWKLLEEQMQTGLRHGAVAYPHSSRPGAKGTLFIAGHSSPPDDLTEPTAYGRLFARLPELAPGETVTVSFAGEILTYEVVDARAVHAFDTSVLRQQSDESLLELITCYPIGTTRDRLIVMARLVQS